MAKDLFHGVVRSALEKDGWKITADPYEINVDDVDFEIDESGRTIVSSRARKPEKAVSTPIGNLQCPTGGDCSILVA